MSFKVNNHTVSSRSPHIGPARAIRYLLLVLAAAATSGCANSYLHNPTRQQQAEVTTTAWKAVEHGSLIATERENLTKLLQAEQDTQVRLSNAIRKHMATDIVAAAEEVQTPAAQTVKLRVLQPATAAFEKLVGPIKNYDERIAADDKTKGIRKDIEGASERLKTLGSPIFDCETRGEAEALPAAATAWLTGLAKRTRTGANDDLRTLKSQCNNLKKLSADENPQPQGQVLLEAIDQLRVDRKVLAEAREAFELAKSNYAAALKAHQQAEEAAASLPSDRTLAARLAEAAKDLKNQITALRGMNNALAQEFISSETLDSIDEALSAIASGDAGDSTKKGMIFALQAPAIIDRYQAAIAESKKPLALPLLIRRRAEELQRNAAANDAKLLQLKVATSERIVAAVQTQAAALRRALRELEKVRESNAGAMDLPWPKALESTSGLARQQLLSGTARYLDAMSRLDGERYRLAYAHIALDHERGLAYAETSVDQWSNLIGAGVGQLEAFAKGGIDKAVLTDIARVLGLFWIGRGVNQ